MEQTNAQQRAKWVERWKDSGLTAKEFAAEAGVTVSALYNWSSQLSAASRKASELLVETSESAMQSKDSPCAKAAKRTANLTPRFVELPIAAVTQAPVMLELLLGDVCIRVPSGFDEATLTRVVRILGMAR